VGEDRSGTSRRVTVAEAAQLLGVTVEAVRGRIKRDTLAYEKTSNGTVYVLLDADRTRLVDDQVADESADQHLLVSRLENEIQFLREELARKDAILLNMTEAMKAIAPPVQEEAPQEPPEAPVTATEQPGSVGPQPEVEGPQQATEQPRRRSWWREFFGFD
jgi:hypothetical protein